MTHADKRTTPAMCRPVLVIFGITSRSTQYYEVISRPADMNQRDVKTKETMPIPPLPLPATVLAQHCDQCTSLAQKQQGILGSGEADLETDLRRKKGRICRREKGSGKNRDERVVMRACSIRSTAVI
ncbi:hypothetical protein ARMGADRAFT_183235 [Armillaria gallica]|uniref:Uncharacterized protein n=1 Tax=Armillaria gallica TaxID=47427 RepID=A0A2H3DT23_ARMGA|nr:hypothetical protein ARMGADRAFT_183235 [Armillaria gallica]